MEKGSGKADYYVSLDGDDANPGGIEKPFFTINRAVVAIRDHSERGSRALTVQIREGTYYLSETVNLGSADSGAKDAPVVFASYPGEQVTLSGGAKLETEWQPYRDGILKCSLPADFSRVFTQLFVNGKRMIRARYPNFAVDDHLVHGRGYTDTLEPVADKNEMGFTYDPAKFTDKVWAHPEKAVLHLSHNWGFLQYRLKSVDRDNSSVYLAEGGWQINFVGPSGEVGMPDPRIRSPWLFTNRRIFIENVFEELDAPGEWYVDEKESTLYFYPPEGLDIKEATVEVPVLETLVNFAGTQQQPARHIRFSGFRFAHTTSTFLDEYEAPSLGDWTIHRGGALFFQGSESCTVSDCFFDATGGNAVFVSDYNRDTCVDGNSFIGIGESAVCVVGSRRKVYGSNLAYPDGVVVKNNYIRDIGAFGKQVAGTFISIAKHVAITHNLMHSLPRAGICLNDCWEGGHVIEHNEIFDTVRETRDHGPFNSWGREGYWCEGQSHHFHNVPAPHPLFIRRMPEQTVIRNNFFHGIEGYVTGDYRQAIDMDDGTLNIHVYNNLCMDIAISIREGENRIVENNIIINPVVPFGCHVLFDNNHDVVKNNIIVTRGDLFHFNDAPPTQPYLDVDYNLFFNFEAPWGYRPLVTVNERGKEGRKYTLNEWQSLGYDAHSRYIDPLFVDPNGGDYQVTSDSPALELGFKNFEMDFGLTEHFQDTWLEDRDKEVIQSLNARLRRDLEGNKVVGGKS